MATPGRFAIPLAVGGALLVFGALTARYVVVDLPGDIAHRAMRDATDSARELAAQVAAAFQVQPKVVVGRETVVEQRSEVAQLVTIEETRTERQRLDESWLHSTKSLEVEADFVIRAGFDLSKPFLIEMDPVSGAARVTLPPAKILSTDLHDVRFLKDENGLWNPLTPDDRERAIRELRLQVARRAQTSDLRERARASAEKRLARLLAQNGRTVTFRPPPGSSPEPASLPKP